jgi:hypothetical protein
MCTVFKATFSISRVLYLLSDHMEYLSTLKQTRTEHAHIHITNTVLKQKQMQARRKGTLALYTADSRKHETLASNTADSNYYAAILDNNLK